MFKICAVMLFSAVMCSIAYSQTPSYDLVAGSAPVCKAIERLENSSVNFNDEQKLKKKLGIRYLTAIKSKVDFGLPHGLLGTELNEFDFNNDGVNDYIFESEDSSPYHIGTWLFVVLGGQKISLDKDGMISLSQVMTFPCQFDNVASASLCPPLSQANDGASIKVTFSNGQKMEFAGRYTGILPIRYRKQTYLILDSSFSGSENIEAVIRPYGVRKFLSVCLLMPR